jgi:1,2-diacylglycerol 3-beta-glucosyltransferase
MNVVLSILEIPAIVAAGFVTGYLALLSILALTARRPAASGPAKMRRFAVVVPAHNEEGALGKTIASLRGLDYPAGLFDVVVIADNCADATAAVARSAGAIALERTDPVNRGKGHALRWAFDALSGRQPGYDAFVVIDADSVATADFLSVMNGELERGAEAIQARDAVIRNAASWSSEITRLGFTLYNHVRPLGRGVIGGSAGLRGNGMCFGAGLLKRIPWDAFGVTEDLQYGLTLLLNGVIVRYAPGATVYATMPAYSANAVSQRARWERGRRPVKRRFSGKLLSLAVRKLSFPALDAWIDLLTPPFVHLMAACAAMAGAHWILEAAFPGAFAFFALAWTLVTGLGLVHVIAGLVAARADAGQYLALCYVPVYAAWKLWLFLRRPHDTPPSEWVRTTREDDRSAAITPDRNGT